MEKIDQLKRIRVLCLLPLCTILLVGMINSMIGVGAFTRSTYYGWTAFALTVIAMVFGYPWISIPCLIGIVVTSVWIKLLERRN